VVIGDSKNYIGKTVAVCSDFISLNGFVAALAEVTGKTLKYVELPTEKMAAMGYPGAEDYANMFAYYSHFDNYNGACNITSITIATTSVSTLGHQNVLLCLTHCGRSQTIASPSSFTNFLPQTVGSVSLLCIPRIVVMLALRPNIG
jgi:hypothetical protein